MVAPTRMQDAVGGADGAGGDDVPEAQLASSANRTTVMSALLLPVRRFASPAIRGGAGTAGAIARGRRGQQKTRRSLHITKSIAAAQSRSNVRKRTQGWTVFHLPSTPGRCSVCRSPLGPAVSPNDAAFRLLPAYLGSARTPGARLRDGAGKSAL